jgi:hypothetical protein
MFIDNDTRALAAMVVDPLTAPDKEDWTIIPDGDRVHMVAYREHDGTAVMMHGEPVPMCEFRRAVRELPPGHDLGVVMAVICPDQRRRGIELVAWLNKMAHLPGPKAARYRAGGMAQQDGSQERLQPDVGPWVCDDRGGGRSDGGEIARGWKRDEAAMSLPKVTKEEMLKAVGDAVYEAIPFIGADEILEAVRNKEACRAQGIFLNEPVGKMGKFFAALRPRIASGSIRMIKPEKPEPPTRRQTVWQDAARQDPIPVHRVE